MAAGLAFLGMWLLSLVVALLAALQLGDFFRTGDELMPVLAVTAIYATIGLVAFALSYRLADRATVLDTTAFFLATLAVVFALWPGDAGWWLTRRIAPSAGTERPLLVLELLVPALLAVLIQWGFVRQRWLRVTGQVDVSRWPWLSTMAACVLTLNPLGLALVWSALRAGPGSPRSDFATSQVVVAACALVVIGVVECYIRWRVQRRRLDG